MEKCETKRTGHSRFACWCIQPAMHHACGKAERKGMGLLDDGTRKSGSGTV